jgi:hypothetical protein
MSTKKENSCFPNWWAERFRKDLEKCEDNLFMKIVNTTKIQDLNIMPTKISPFPNLMN